MPPKAGIQAGAAAQPAADAAQRHGSWTFGDWPEIMEIRKGAGFSVIHLLSVWVLVALAAAIWHIRRGNVRAHKRFMVGTLLGLGPYKTFFFIVVPIMARASSMPSSRTPISSPSSASPPPAVSRVLAS